jgi:hypothetical protein
MTTLAKKRKMTRRFVYVILALFFLGSPRRPAGEAPMLAIR